MPYPEKLLADDEEVVAHLHPHAVAAFWPVVRLLSVVGAASFGAAMVPAGGLQRSIRLAIAAVALLLVVLSVAGPLMRWRTTHYVITTHRLLHRSGVLTRRGRDIPLSRITDVSFSQTLWERVIRAGTLAVTSAGDGTTVLRRVPISERVQQLLNHMIEEDAVRRGQGSAGHHGDDGRQSADRWDTWTTGAGWTDSDPGLVTVRGVTERLAVEGRTGPVR